MATWWKKKGKEKKRHGISLKLLYWRLKGDLLHMYVYMDKLALLSLKQPHRTP